MIVLLLLAQAAQNPAAPPPSPVLTTWLPLITAIATVGGLIFIAMKARPEGQSALLADAMKMVAELKAQRGEDRARIEHLEDSLQEARTERQQQQQEMVRLYRRIDELEARLGGRRASDDP